MVLVAVLKVLRVTLGKKDSRGILVPKGILETRANVVNRESLEITPILKALKGILETKVLKDPKVKKVLPVLQVLQVPLVKKVLKETQEKKALKETLANKVTKVPMVLRDTSLLEEMGLLPPLTDRKATGSWTRATSASMDLKPMLAGVVLI